MHDKSLLISFRKDEFGFDVSSYGTGIDALAAVISDPHFPGLDAVGSDSWARLKSYLSPIVSTSALICLSSVDLGDWRVKVICDV